MEPGTTWDQDKVIQVVVGLEVDPGVEGHVVVGHVEVVQSAEVSVEVPVEVVPVMQVPEEVVLGEE